MYYVYGLTVLVCLTDVKGVQGFWLTAFKNVELLASMIQEHDEPILECLTDVKVQFSAQPMVSTAIIYLHAIAKPEVF